MDLTRRWASDGYEAALAPSYLACMGVRPVVVRPDRRRGGRWRGRSRTCAYDNRWWCRTHEQRNPPKGIPLAAARAGLLVQKTVPFVGCGSG
jgi:hypothetical protein